MYQIYLKQLKVKSINKTFEYIDKELIQFIDATDNMQSYFNRLNVFDSCKDELEESLFKNNLFIL